MQLTKDNVPVLFHNFTIKNGSNEYRSIGRIEESELRLLLGKGQSESGRTTMGFCTLAEALLHVDSRLGFNIELKYPNFQTKDQEDLKVPGFNEFCDRILDILLKYSGTRQIFISSFNPHVSF